MNVVDANGETEMDEDQWEAASKLRPLQYYVSFANTQADIYIAFAMERR
jgi:hypothetical protein